MSGFYFFFRPVQYYSQGSQSRFSFFVKRTNIKLLSSQIFVLKTKNLNMN